MSLLISSYGNHSSHEIDSFASAKEQVMTKRLVEWELIDWLSMWSHYPFIRTQTYNEGCSLWRKKVAVILYTRMKHELIQTLWEEGGQPYLLIWTSSEFEVIFILAR